jgi:hypothetical protein
LYSLVKLSALSALVVRRFVTYNKHLLSSQKVIDFLSYKLVTRLLIFTI